MQCVEWPVATDVARSVVSVQGCGVLIFGGTPTPAPALKNPPTPS